MFNFVGKNKRLLQFFLALIIVPVFALFGIESYQGFVGAGGAVAEVAGEPISEQEFERALADQRDRLRNAFGGKIDAAMFDQLFADEAKLLGHMIPGKDVLALLSGDLRPRVVAAFKACKAKFTTGCITTNAPTGKGAGMSSNAEKAKQIAEVFSLFEHDFHR